MIKEYDAILLTAGKGERFGLPLNKVFYVINNKTIFEYSLDAFLSDERCKKVVIVYSAEWINLIKDVLSKYNTDRIDLVIGGALRQESVLNGLSKASCEYVLVHDAARPNISIKLIDNVLAGLKKSKAVSLGVKVTDTIKKVTEKLETVDRENLYYVQTPQGASRSLLYEALKLANNQNAVVTDDLAAIERYSDIIPLIVEGSKSNIKVTTIDDIDLIKFYLEKKDV